MKKTHLFLTSIVAFVVVIGTSGCRSSEDKPSVDDQSAEEIAELLASDIPIDESPLYDLYQKADELLTGGNTNEANTLFIDALDDARFEGLKSPLFNTMIRYFVFTKQLEIAQEQYLNALRTFPEIAEPGFDTIYGAYMSAGDFEGALAWARVLSTQDIGDDLRMTATHWLIGSLFRNDKLDEMNANVALAVEQFDAVRFAPLLVRVGEEALGEGNITAAEELCALVEASTKRDAAPYIELLTTMRVRIDAEKGNWEKIAVHLPELLLDVSDQPLQQAVAHVFQSARRAKRFDMIELMASAIIHSEQAVKRERTRALAAHEWVRVIFDRPEKDLSSFPVRMNVLLEKGFSAPLIFTIYKQHFYDLITDLDVLKVCIPLGDELLPMLAGDMLQNELRSYQLDACFLVEDFDRALAILEKGFVGRRADWHTMTIAKVKAHKAQQEGRYEDAVGYYRQFMGAIKNEDISDPATDVVYSRVTLLGNNEKRIGDIYSEAGKSDEAEHAYAAARKWYEQALASNRAGEPTASYIRGQMEAVPKTVADEDSPSALIREADGADSMPAEPVEEVPES